MPVGKSKEVFDQRGGTGLSTRGITFQNNRFQSFGSGINRRGQAGRSCANDSQIGQNFGLIFVGERPKQAGFACATSRNEGLAQAARRPE